MSTTLFVKPSPLPASIFCAILLVTTVTSTDIARDIFNLERNLDINGARLLQASRPVNQDFRHLGGLLEKRNDIQVAEACSRDHIRGCTITVNESNECEREVNCTRASKNRWNILKHQMIRCWATKAIRYNLRWDGELLNTSTADIMMSIYNDDQVVDSQRLINHTLYNGVMAIWNFPINNTLMKTYVVRANIHDCHRLINN